MKLNTYLHFDGQTEEAFEFYKSVFGGEFSEKMKMVDGPDAEKLSKEDQNRIMHIALPLSDHALLMGSDMCSGGDPLNKGNNLSISIHPESKKQADQLFNGLSKGGKVESPMKEEFWGDYFGSFTDKFGINWMINLAKK